MRLTERSPHWMYPANFVEPDPLWKGEVTWTPFYTGVSFLCPHCGSRIGVSFKPPIDPKGYASKFPLPDKDWHTRTGETFETLTLTPSLRIEGHLHCSIVNGNLEVQP